MVKEVVNTNEDKITALKVGSKLPKFSLCDQNGKVVTEKDLVGKYTVLYTYPKDSTLMCTIQGKDFTALAEKFSRLNAQVVGLSKDSVASHQKFSSKYAFTHTILSDPELKLITALGAKGNKLPIVDSLINRVTRSTIIVDPNLQVIKIYRSVKAIGHAKAVLQFLTQLISQNYEK